MFAKKKHPRGISTYDNCENYSGGEFYWQNYQSCLKPAVIKLSTWFQLSHIFISTEQIGLDCKQKYVLVLSAYYLEKDVTSIQGHGFVVVMARTDAIYNNFIFGKMLG